MTPLAASATSGRSPWPTLGFVCLVASIGLTLAFFVWGFRRPELDRVWTLHHRLKIGEVTQLAPADEQLLARNMRKYPELASALLGGRTIGVISARNWQGWLQVPQATIIRTQESTACTKLQLGVHTEPGLMPFPLNVQGANWTERVHVTAAGPLAIQLPPVTENELILVRFEGHKFPKDASRIGVKLDVVCEPSEVTRP